MTQNGDDLNQALTDEDLGRLQFTTLLYYLHESNPDNGLVRDKTEPTAPVSIAAVGMALATIPVVVERGVLIREFAAKIHTQATSVFVRMSARARAQRFGLSRFLLSLSPNRIRSPSLAMRVINN